MAAIDVAMGGTDELELPPRKKPKVSELPLSSAQRASIDSLLHTFKKKGEFDALRKKTFQQYNESAQRGMFEASLRAFTTNEIERDAIKYLKPDRRVTAQLLEGAAARADTYARTEADIDAYIDGHLANAEQALRAIRRQDIGGQAADLELQRGSRSDDVYAAEAQERSRQRSRDFDEAEKRRKKDEAKERKKKELEALLKKQEELKKETERLQREQQRRAEREAFKVAEKERDRERIRKFNEERERQQKETQDREQKLRQEEERRRKERADREQKRLEEDALNELLREGQRMADRGKRHDLQRSESMEPPSRLSKQSHTPHNTLSRDEMRSAGLMPTSLTLRRGADPATPSAPAGSTSASGRGEGTRNASRVRSPSPHRSTAGRSRRDGSPRGDDRGSSRRDANHRQSLYRDISAEREAWKAKLRDQSANHGEEGEVVERVPPSRARSRSRDSNRRRRISRSPPRRGNREHTRSRTPPRRYKDRDHTPPRRERSRSPPGIDRYVPGGGSSRRGRETDDRPTRRARDDDDRPARRRRDDEEDRDRRRSGRFDERPKDIDRYVPGSRNDDRDARRRDRTRSRSRPRERDRDRERRSERDRSRPREREREREPAPHREKPEGKE